MNNFSEELHRQGQVTLKASHNALLKVDDTVTAFKQCIDNRFDADHVKAMLFQEKGSIALCANCEKQTQLLVEHAEKALATAENAHIHQRIAEQSLANVQIKHQEALMSKEKEIQRLKDEKNSMIESLRAVESIEQLRALLPATAKPISKPKYTIFVPPGQKETSRNEEDHDEEEKLANERMAQIAKEETEKHEKPVATDTTTAKRSNEDTQTQHQDQPKGKISKAAIGRNP